MIMEDHGGGGTTSSRHGIDGDDDFIMMDDFIEDADNNRDDEDGEVALDDPEDMKFFEEGHLDNDDLLYGTPRWLDNFKEM